MTMTVRKQLSVAAWGASAFCALMLMLSAQAAVQHYMSMSRQTTEMPSIGASRQVNNTH